MHKYKLQIRKNYNTLKRLICSKKELNKWFDLSSEKSKLITFVHKICK